MQAADRQQDIDWSTFDFSRFDRPDAYVAFVDMHGVIRWRNQRLRRDSPMSDTESIGGNFFQHLDTTQIKDHAPRFVTGLQGDKAEWISEYPGIGLVRAHVEPATQKGNQIGMLFVGHSLRDSEAPSASPHRRTWAHYLTGELNRSPRTALTYETNVARLEQLIGKRAEDITIEDWRHFSRTSTLKPRSKSGMFAALKSYLRFLTIEGLAGRSPLLDVPGPKIITDEDDDLPPLSVDDARRVIQACKTAKDYRLVYLALYGGLRISECESIGEAEWLEDRLRFTGKGRKKRSVPIHPELEKVRHVILSNPVEEKGLKHTAPGLSHATSIPFTAHTLRRTFASTLREMRVSTDVIARLMGHAEKVTSQSYARVTWREMSEAVAALRY